MNRNDIQELWELGHETFYKNMPINDIARDRVAAILVYYLFANKECSKIRESAPFADSDGLYRSADPAAIFILLFMYHSICRQYIPALTKLLADEQYKSDKWAIWFLTFFKGYDYVATPEFTRYSMSLVSTPPTLFDVAMAGFAHHASEHNPKVSRAIPAHFLEAIAQQYPHLFILVLHYLGDETWLYDPGPIFARGANGGISEVSICVIDTIYTHLPIKYREIVLQHVVFKLREMVHWGSLFRDDFLVAPAFVQLVSDKPDVAKMLAEKMKDHLLFDKNLWKKYPQQLRVWLEAMVKPIETIAYGSKQQEWYVKSVIAFVAACPQPVTRKSPDIQEAIYKFCVTYSDVSKQVRATKGILTTDNYNRLMSG